MDIFRNPYYSPYHTHAPTLTPLDIDLATIMVNIQSFLSDMFNCYIAFWMNSGILHMAFYTLQCMSHVWVDVVCDFCNIGKRACRANGYVM